MVNSISLNAYSYGGILSGSSGKLYVPVNPASVIYSQFDHISGVASSIPEHGVSVSKIQILNSLLNQLISMRNQPKAEFSDNSNLSDDQMESLIQNYQSQIQNEIEKSHLTGYGLAGVQPQTGQLLDLTA